MDRMDKEIRCSCGGHTSSMLVDYGVGVDPAACNEHLKLSFAASTQSHASNQHTASHQPIHAASRLHFKLKRRAPVIQPL